MKFIPYILIFSILLQSVQWHPEEIGNIKIFLSDAKEHLKAGDSFLDFLEKHYGSEEVVSKHLDHQHPDRKKSEEKHTHHIETPPVWNFDAPGKIEIKLDLCKQQSPDLYKDFLSCVHIIPLYSPPELI